MLMILKCVGTKICRCLGVAVCKVVCMLCEVSVKIFLILPARTERHVQAGCLLF